jgi:N-acetylglucosamine-6-sulfatase
MRALPYAVAGALALGGTAAAVGGTESAGARGPDQRPNVVVVMTDDQNAASVAVMPRVNAELVAGGATFPDNFTNWPLCCPSRATLYTGQYARNHHVLGNAPPAGGFTRLDDSNALPLWLKRAGYETVHIGKYLNGYGEESTDPAYVPPGWDEWVTPTGGTTQTVYDYILNVNGNLVQRGHEVADFKQDVLTDYAVDAINRRAPGGPFFLDLQYTAPHGGGPNPNPQPPSNCGGGAPKPAPRHADAFNSQPLPLGPSFNEADVTDKPAAIQALPGIDDTAFDNIQRKWRCRMEALQSVDDGIGRVLDALRAAGELDQTLIVFTSDNGFFHGEHRVPTGKNRVYEEAIRVPLVMRGPGVPAGVVANDLAINADLAPTILEAAGATPGRTVDGRSLLPFAEHPARLHGRELLIQQGDGVDSEDEVITGGRYDAIRTSRYIYVSHATGERELYDLEKDPDELVNQVANPAYDGAEAALSRRLAALRDCSGQSCRTKPTLKLKLPRTVRERGHSCRETRNFLVRVRGADAGNLVEVSFSVGSRAAGHDGEGPFKKELRPRLLRGKRRPAISAVAELADGRMLTVRKRARICR